VPSQDQLQVSDEAFVASLAVSLTLTNCLCAPYQRYSYHNAFLIKTA